MNLRSRTTALLVALALAASACGDDTDSPADPAEPDRGGIDDVRLDELQVVGSHNSYRLPPPPEIAEVIEVFSAEFWSELDYIHESLTDQLETYGIRQLELDVFADPEGGRFASRAGPPIVGLPAESGEAALDEPGFKVKHIQDFDYGTTCLTLVACLDEIEAWSTANPDHVPLKIMVEVKTDTIEQGADDLGIDLSVLDVEWTEPLAMTPALFAELEEEILSVFPPDRIVTPDEVRGDHETLSDAIAAGGWPTLGETRGRVVFSLLNHGEVREVYRGWAGDLTGRVLFPSADPGDVDAAFVRVDDPVGDADRLADAVAAGYLVRTRSDTPTVHARTGDTSRRDAALASGAHYISTDFYVEREDFGTGFVVRLPDGAAVRCNPVTARERCDDASLDG